MLNFLNALELDASAYLLLSVVGVVLIMQIVLLAVVISSARAKKKGCAGRNEERRVVSISIDTGMVRRQYSVGDDLDLSGLIVTANYSSAPYQEVLQSYTVVTPELVADLSREGKTPESIDGCRVYPPNLGKEGKPVVAVIYRGMSALFAVSVTAADRGEAITAVSPADEETEPVPVEVVETVLDENYRRAPLLETVLDENYGKARVEESVIDGASRVTIVENVIGRA